MKTEEMMGAEMHTQSPFRVVIVCALNVMWMGQNMCDANLVTCEKASGV
jgi:hypothetical protein